MNLKFRTPDMFGLMKTIGVMGIVFIILPILVVIPMSFVAERYLKFPPSEWSLVWYKNLFTESQWYEPLLRSIGIAVCVAILSIILGLLGAYGLYHTHGKKKAFLMFLFLLPLFIPPVVLGVGLLLVMARVQMVDTIPGVIVSHVLLAFPYSCLVFSAAFAGANMKLEEIAYSMGATRFYAFSRVILPQIKPGIVAAGILSFIVSFDEPVLTLFLTSTHARTLPRQMFDGIRYDLDPTAAAVSSMLIGLMVLLVFLTTKRRTLHSIKGEIVRRKS